MFCFGKTLNWTIDAGKTWRVKSSRKIVFIFGKVEWRPGVTCWRHALNCVFTNWLLPISQGCPREIDMSAIIDRLRFVYRYAIRAYCANLAKTLKKIVALQTLFSDGLTQSCGRQEESCLRHRCRLGWDVSEGDLELLGGREERRFYIKK